MRLARSFAASTSDGQRGDRADVKWVVHSERAVLDVDRSGTAVAARAPRGVQDLEVVAGVIGRPLVGQAEHVADDPVMGRTESQRQAAASDRLRGQRLPGQRDRICLLYTSPSP